MKQKTIRPPFNPSRTKPPFKDCKVSSLADNKEYQEAVEHEKFNRLIPFLNLTETVAGFECVPMTLNHLVLFRIDGNACFSNAVPTDAEMINFFWVLSPGYSRGWKSKVSKWCLAMRYKGAFIPPSKPVARFLWQAWAKVSAARILAFQQAVGEARKYIEDTFQDQSRGKSTGESIEYFCDAAWICDLFGREYGWTVDRTMNTPLRLVFQLLRCVRQHNFGEKAGLGNKSSEILHRQN